MWTLVALGVVVVAGVATFALKGYCQALSNASTSTEETGTTVDPALERFFSEGRKLFQGDAPAYDCSGGGDPLYEEAELQADPGFGGYDSSPTILCQQGLEPTA
jgi:hypothetical protein